MAPASTARRAQRRYKALRGKLEQAVDALEAALYSENEKRLDAAEDTLEDLEFWLDEHPTGSAPAAAVPKSSPLRPFSSTGARSWRANKPIATGRVASCEHGHCAGFPGCACTCHGTTPTKDDPEGYAG